jgi:DNA-binding transcriptional LysR family regulator
VRREQERLLRDGRADVALLHRPFDSTAGLDTESCSTERQVAILPAGHPLAGRPQSAWPTSPGCRTCRCLAGPDPDGGYPDGPGPGGARQLTQLFQLIALGRTITVIPESIVTDLRRDLAAVPVLDAPPVTTVIAWPPQSRLRSVADLIRLATRL